MYVFAVYGVPCLAAGCRGSGAGQQAVRPGRGMLHQIIYSLRLSPLPPKKKSWFRLVVLKNYLQHLD